MTYNSLRHIMVIITAITHLEMFTNFEKAVKFLFDSATKNKLCLWCNPE